MVSRRTSRGVAVALFLALLALGAIAVPASAEVLVDQIESGQPASYSSGSILYPPETGYSAQTNQTADDFTVPEGARWTISQVDVRGAGYGGMASQAVSVFFYADASGLPGAQEYVQTTSMSTVDANFSIPLATPAALDAGTHWLSVQVTGVDGSGNSEWFWLDRLAKSGNPAAYRGNTGPCPSWGVRTTCQGGFGEERPDQLFKLSGTSGPPSAGGAGGSSGGGGGNGGGPAGTGGSLPANAFSFGALKLNRKKGTATLAIEVPGPGSLTLAGKALKKLSRSVTAAGEVKLSLKAKGKAKKKLDRAGSLKLNLQVTYTPLGGGANTETRKVVLKKHLFRRPMG